MLFLPVFIFIWFTGWILTQIQEPRRSAELGSKALRAPPRLESLEKESKVPDEASRITAESDIVA